ncbi:MAG: imidazole glycerol phosphate synthase subunit HisH [Lentisphaeria bacterium]|jgi:glutamine amidotransferase|nr:imidazole glycerol phosphate synthase subunit HisH [Lentisphaeria bacterium]
MIAIVDYRAGNLTSVAAAFAKLGYPAKVTSDPADLAAAERVVFPGVGAAESAMANLHEMGLFDPLLAAIHGGKPFLGICIGFQLLFESSEEDGGVACLGALPGPVVRFPDNLHEGDDPQPLKIPHMGWNQVTFTRPHPVWEGIPEDAEFYFVHSYYPVPPPELVAATTVYGKKFACAVARGNLVASQFHPEKSGRPGLKLLDNFCRWNP